MALGQPVATFPFGEEEGCPLPSQAADGAMGAFAALAEEASGFAGGHLTAARNNIWGL